MARRLPSGSTSMISRLCSCLAVSGAAIVSSAPVARSRTSSPLLSVAAYPSLPFQRITAALNPRGNGISIDAPPCTGIFRHKLYAELV